MKVVVKKRTEAYINGKPYIVNEGVQELEKPLAELLLNVGLAFLPPSQEDPSSDSTTSESTTSKVKKRRQK